MRWRTKLPWLAVAAFFLAAIVWFARDRRIPREAFDDYSVYNTAEKGLSLAYKYLCSDPRAGAVGTLSRPPERSFLEADAVIFRIRPNSPVPPGLQRPEASGG